MRTNSESYTGNLTSIMTKNSLKTKESDMDEISKLVPMLWDMAKNKKRFTVNLHSKENEIIVNILSGNRWRRFKNKSPDVLVNEIKDSLVLA